MNLDQSYRKKEFWDDTVVNCIISNYISLKDKDIKINNQHLQKIILKGLIPLMQEDALFKDTYKNINYAGSFFKGTKVGKPDEYDLDLRIRLPLNYRTLKVETNHTNYGYVKVKVDDISKLPKWETHSKILNKWLDNEGYLDQNKFRQWMEKVMTKTYDRLKKVDKDYELVVEDKTYILKQYKKSGPAFTIYVEPKDKSEDDHIMVVDLVPCLEFEDIILDGYKQIPNMTRKLIIVAKPSNEHDGNRLWRLSFYEQEKQILQEKEAGKLKPIIRLIKKLRDKLEWKQLASYYIETLCLHELYARKAENDIVFFRAPKACLFIYMLEKLREVIYLKRLPYFWHAKHNLLANMKDIVSENYTHRLHSILNLIQKNISINRFIIAEQMLSASEVSTLRAIVLPGIDKTQMKKGNSEDTDLTTSMEDLDISGSQKSDSEIDSIDLMNCSESSNAELDTVASPQEMGKTATNHSENSITIKSRVELLCQELAAFSNLRNELSEEEKEQLSKSCMSLFITLSRRLKN